MEGKIFSPVHSFRGGGDSPPTVALGTDKWRGGSTPTITGVFKGLLQSSLRKGGDWQTDSRSKGQKMAKWEHHKLN